MNRLLVAKELLRLAKELVSMEFDTEEEMKKYKQEHDVRPGTKLTVKKDKREEQQQKATHDFYDSWIDKLASFDEGKSLRKELENDSSLKPAYKEKLIKKLDSVFWKQRWPTKGFRFPEVGTD
jgi:hypothetical protein